jgi:hypothetical protein
MDAHNDCETSRLPYFLHNRLTDGIGVVGSTRRPPFTPPPPRKIPHTQFCWRLSRPEVHSEVQRIKKIHKSNDLIGNQSQDVSACDISAVIGSKWQSRLVQNLRSHARLVTTRKQRV